MRGQVPFSHFELFFLQNFLAQINESSDIEQIKRIHFNILTEIVQATTLCNVQAAKGIGTSVESLDNILKSQPNPRQEEEDEERERHQQEQLVRLQRYIGQLVQAKTLCDNRLRDLDCNVGTANNITTKKYSGEHGPGYYEQPLSNPMMGPQVISLAFDSIMNSPFSRRYFYTYLEGYSKGRAIGDHDQRDTSPFTKSVVPPYQVRILQNANDEYWLNLVNCIFETE